MVLLKTILSINKISNHWNRCFDDNKNQDYETMCTMTMWLPECQMSPIVLGY